jgi:hypothetical protein
MSKGKVEPAVQNVVSFARLLPEGKADGSAEL